MLWATTADIRRICTFPKRRSWSAAGKDRGRHRPEGGNAEELFAGAEILHVKDGQILIAANSHSVLTDGAVTLRRQVAGTFGYFTRIPATIDGHEVVTARLVANPAQPEHPARRLPFNRRAGEFFPRECDQRHDAMYGV